MRAPLALAAAAAIGAAAAGAAPTPPTLAIDKMAFAPQPTVLRVGETVEWVNRDMFQHTATARDGSFDVMLPPNGRARVVLRAPGKIQVYCRYHPGMTTVLTVVR